jgi:2,4-dienoyl-CoA reductase-like NADH-dependent reductase (Old Yellow Enzyme family)
MLHDAGGPSDDMVAYHEARAAGLLITEAACGHPSVSAVPILAYSDVGIPDYRTVAEPVHAHGCMAFGQISHGGAHCCSHEHANWLHGTAGSGSQNKHFEASACRWTYQSTAGHRAGIERRPSEHMRHETSDD